MITYNINNIQYQKFQYGISEKFTISFKQFSCLAEIKLLDLLSHNIINKMIQGFQQDSTRSYHFKEYTNMRNLYQSYILQKIQLCCRVPIDQMNINIIKRRINIQKQFLNLQNYTFFQIETNL
ncbi:hypothetical protein pb186bvf_021053 [Paramecium bursaria]